MQKVIISSSFGCFEPNEEYQALLDKKELNWWDLKARTDEEIIKFIESNMHDEYKVSQVGKEDYTYVSIANVDTSIPWTIEEYDGSESILHIVYNVIDEELNYCEMK